MSNELKIGGYEADPANFLDAEKFSRLAQEMTLKYYFLPYIEEQNNFYKKFAQDIANAFVFFGERQRKRCIARLLRDIDTKPRVDNIPAKDHKVDPKTNNYIDDSTRIYLQPDLELLAEEDRQQREMAEMMRKLQSGLT